MRSAVRCSRRGWLSSVPRWLLSAGSNGSEHEAFHPKCMARQLGRFETKSRACKLMELAPTYQHFQHCYTSRILPDYRLGGYAMCSAPLDGLNRLESPGGKGVRDGYKAPVSLLFSRPPSALYHNSRIYIRQVLCILQSLLRELVLALFLPRCLSTCPPLLP